MATRLNNFYFVPAESERAPMSTSKRKRELSPSGCHGPPHRAASKSTIYQTYQQNSQSPLFRLPAEIRNQIFEFALGNKVIHTSVRNCLGNDTGAHPYSDYYTGGIPSSRGKRKASEPDAYLRLTHAVCSLPLDAEDRAYEQNRRLDLGLNDDTSSLPGEEPYHKRHAKCYHTLAWLKQNLNPHLRYLSDAQRLSRASQLPVALLRTCRQINKESRHLLYSTNTFAFHEGYTLDFFFSKVLTARQRSQIRSLQTDGWMTYADQPYAIPDKTIQMLKGLQSLQAWVVYGPSYWRTAHQFYIPPQSSLRHHRHETSWCVSPFAKLGLSNVKVIVGPCPIESRACSPKQRRQAAEEIEKKMKGHFDCYAWCGEGCEVWRPS